MDRAEAAGPWTDSLGLMATRCAQILLIAAVVVGLLWLLARVGLVVVAALVAPILASAVHPLVGWLIRKRWSPLLATIATFATSGTFLGGALSGLGAASGFVTGAVLMIVVLFFFLKDGPMLWSFTLRWFHGETRARLAESGDRTVQLLGGYVRGTATIAAVDALFIGVPLAILGGSLAVSLAVIVFVGAFVPIVGKDPLSATNRAASKSTLGEVDPRRTVEVPADGPRRRGGGRHSARRRCRRGGGRARRTPGLRGAGSGDAGPGDAGPCRRAGQSWGNCGAIHPCLPR